MIKYYEAGAQFISSETLCSAKAQLLHDELRSMLRDGKIL